ncbi:sugar ABC transporter substrate-binding protein [Nonomuraea sp. NPDC049625]|uniref:ABC transporter substrate-binding protein n=1 Tax=Nonomuraea sp. NPDC049625 TaxID=3155775 RepID=UPI00342C93C0
MDNPLRGLNTTGLNRRQVLSLAAMAAAAVPLTACGSGERTRQAGPASSTASASGNSAVINPDRPESALFPYAEAEKLFDSLPWPKTNVPEPTSKVTVTVAIIPGQRHEVRHAQFAKFIKKRHPNIEIKVEVTPFDDFRTKYLTGAASGVLPDIMYSQFQWGQSFIKNNLYLPLDDYIAATPEFNRADFSKAALSYWERDGKLYALGTDSAPKLLFYNKEILDKAGAKAPDASWTWDKLMEAARGLVSGTGAQKVFGFTPVPKPTSDLTATFLLAHGGRYLTADETKCVIQEPASRDVLKRWIDLLIKDKAMPDLAEAQATAKVEPFTLGRGALYVGGAWNIVTLLTLPAEQQFEWSLTHVPSGPEGRFTPVLGSAFGITSRTRNPEAAWIVLNSLRSYAGHRFFLDTPPSRLSAFEENLQDLKLDKEVIDTTKDSLHKYGTSDGVLRLPATPKLEDLTKPIWERVMSGSLSVDEGLKQVTERVTPMLAENV